MNSTTHDLSLGELLRQKLVHLELKPTTGRERFEALTYSIDELMVVLQYRRRQSVSWWANKWKVRKIKDGVGYRLVVEEVHAVLISQGENLDNLREIIRIRMGI